MYSSPRSTPSSAWCSLGDSGHIINAFDLPGIVGPEMFALAATMASSHTANVLSLLTKNMLLECYGCRQDVTFTSRNLITDVCAVLGQFEASLRADKGENRHVGHVTAA